jgi:hypothetical protein
MYPSSLAQNQSNSAATGFLLTYHTLFCPGPVCLAAGQSVAELQAKAAPVTPELAVLITPFMVALSGAR